MKPCQAIFPKYPTSTATIAASQFRLEFVQSCKVPNDANLNQVKTSLQSLRKFDVKKYVVCWRGVV